ncbi:unnamed protein product [Mytilus edulis]|uniref:Uncharacterized protein n=1 Tax=Mytilus edulis TaxID=6550 RepID=A0A8S3SN64_MYTED|nr:unnamed protein product [Mytilus edulis]
MLFHFLGQKNHWLLQHRNSMKDHDADQSEEQCQLVNLQNESNEPPKKAIKVGFTPNVSHYSMKDPDADQSEEQCQLVNSQNESNEPPKKAIKVDLKNSKKKFEWKESTKGYAFISEMCEKLNYKRGQHVKDTIFRTGVKQGYWVSVSALITGVFDEQETVDGTSKEKKKIIIADSTSAMPLYPTATVAKIPIHVSSADTTIEIHVSTKPKDATPQSAATSKTITKDQDKSTSYYMHSTIPPTTASAENDIGWSRLRDLCPSEEPDEEDGLSYFPSLQKVRRRGQFISDKKRPRMKDDVCSKLSKGHPSLLPGVFTLFCPHGGVLIGNMERYIDDVMKKLGNLQIKEAQKTEDSTKKHTGLVILPLKALMKDTISSLREHNIPAYGLLEDAEKDLAGIGDGLASILFTSPEAIPVKFWRDVIKI